MLTVSVFHMFNDVIIPNVDISNSNSRTIQSSGLKKFLKAS